jgi:hypothetical protein
VFSSVHTPDVTFSRRTPGRDPSITSIAESATIRPKSNWPAPETGVGTVQTESRVTKRRLPVVVPKMTWSLERMRPKETEASCGIDADHASSKTSGSEVVGTAGVPEHRSAVWINKESMRSLDIATTGGSEGLFYPRNPMRL